MVDGTQTVTRLRRGAFARLFAGTPFQWILTVGIVLEVCLVAFVSTFTSFGKIAPALAPGLVIWIIWLAGVFAQATADGDGIRWRYYRPYRLAWSDVEQVRFGGRLAVAGMSTVGEAAIFVQVRGREHRIAPAAGCGRNRLLEFGGSLIRLADAKGVPATVTTGDTWWAPLQQG
jgi:hypothetical protein